MLIDSAIKYSPEARKSRSMETRADLNLKMNKKAIFDIVSLHSSYGYGTNYSAVNNQSAVVGNNLTTSQSAFYNLGVGVQLPLSMLVNRKNVTRIQKTMLDVAVAEKDNSELQIKQDVITLYQEFKLEQKLLVISSKNKQSAEVNNTIAQKDFLNAQISIDQVSAVAEKYNKSVVDFETNIIKFQTSLMQLQAYTHTDLSLLIRKL
ncbi:TolC family protein [Ferruginibacter sp.]|uniref:TolC family protein n=1 Tax=Ferruginibacter sp. TaxID=1940288 RepID=UPI00265AEB77|nr:TolC family protein [Ferruginibacter sp.]